MLIFIGKIFDVLHEMPSLTSIATASFAFSTLSFTLLSRSAGSCIEKREVDAVQRIATGEAQYLYNQELVYLFPFAAAPWTYSSVILYSWTV